MAKELGMGASVSVVIPVYNRQSLIGRAIESVMDQILPGDEILVVDDGSTDDSSLVVGQYGNAVRLIKQPNGGAGAARNIGIANATKPLVAFLDSDDMWLPNKLQIQREIMDNMPEVVMCFADYVQQDEDGPMMPYRMTWQPTDLGPRLEVTAGSERVVCHVGRAYTVLMRLGPQVQVDTVMMRRDAIPPEPFAVDLKIFEEEQAFAKLARLGLVAYLQREVSVMWGHSGSRLTDVMNSVEPDTAWLTVLQRVWGQDTEFLRIHEAEYKQALASGWLGRARGHLAHGEYQLARQDIKRAAEFRRSARVAKFLPMWLLKTALHLRDKLN